MEISCEPPNNRLDKFKGKLVYEDTMYPLDNENVILRVRFYFIYFFLFTMLFDLVTVDLIVVLYTFEYIQNLLS